MSKVRANAEMKPCYERRWQQQAPLPVTQPGRQGRGHFDILHAELQRPCRLLLQLPLLLLLLVGAGGSSHGTWGRRGYWSTRPRGGFLRGCPR